MHAEDTKTIIKRIMKDVRALERRFVEMRNDAREACRIGTVLGQELLRENKAKQRRTEAKLKRRVANKR